MSAWKSAQLCSKAFTERSEARVFQCVKHSWEGVGRTRDEREGKKKKNLPPFITAALLVALRAFRALDALWTRRWRR